MDQPDALDLILFDGDCVLCSHSARFVHARDRDGRFRYVAIQSEAGQVLARRLGIDPLKPATNAVILNGKASVKSDAVFAVLGVLPGYGWTRVAKLAPRAFRDWVYDRVARNRYAWFGRKENCLAPDMAMRARILERAEQLG
jgi:predicted DCC family thiol-disulfide oxidoreductase YuxK